MGKQNVGGELIDGHFSSCHIIESFGSACVIPVYSRNVGADILVFAVMTQHQTEL